MGNLVLVNQANVSLWESFHYPTDTIVIGQQLPVGTSLSGAVSASDLSTSDYQLGLTSSDARLQWHGQTYWKLSMDTRAYTVSGFMVEFMVVNGTGLYLLGHNGSVVVQVVLASADFRIAKLDASGQFTVNSFSNGKWNQEFVGPSDSCRLPFVCDRIGQCSANSASKTPDCSCPSNFHPSSPSSNTCVPFDGSFSLFSACNSSNNGSQVNSSAASYLTIGYGHDYFSNDFSERLEYGVNLSVCQEVCSGDCSCFGVFYENSSGSCYKIENKLGSIISSTSSENDLLGYIKVVAAPSTNFDGNNNSGDQSQEFPLVALILLPSAACCVLIAIGLVWLRRRRISKFGEVKLGHPSSPSSEELDAFRIPGLPRRFDYKELEVATDNFKTLIGSGGFGAVYKGTLPDKTVVAVKKITNLGIQGKRDFCTEIAVIGNIHHVNLVKLKGFCAQGSVRLLVYEYMNRGSLDRILFGTGPVLEWQERLNIALGTARGLAYLHRGCEHKIIHCDIKPENILLHDHFPAKISDFGLSKLLNPEQSSLFTTMRGTRGYLAPEWLTSSAITEKTDVYSFGMVLLELVSGRKNCLLRTQSHSLEDDSTASHASSSSGSGLIYFPLFALEMHEQGKYLELADPRLENRVTSQEVEGMTRVALCCVHEEPSLRPNMATVVGMLEGRIPFCQPRVESLNFLRFYGRRFTEASMIGEQNRSNNAILYSEANVLLTSTAGGSHRSFSYMSSQQVSGPR
ncbi:G-type lectin S-receptor-like serine/threonine-protein kinase At5g35370 isoform X2 [Rhodamnia argentea]|nr:G-type lectin S-receptor-like serine/threonine-protein kinase At5g35370 isoform X2 [Rhodamnia argentea]